MEQVQSKKSSYRTRTGHERIKLYRTSRGPRATQRRLRVIEALEAQLQSGMKPASRKRPEPMALDEADIKRIRSEIATLKSRV